MVVGNCNAVIFENADSLLIVDTHSYPSAVASLVAQIRNELTHKPVRYVVNTHFHGDHVQGNPGYVKEFPKADIVASEATKQLMGQLAEKRIRAGLGEAARLYRPGRRESVQGENCRSARVLCGRGAPMEVLSCRNAGLSCRPANRDIRGFLPH